MSKARAGTFTKRETEWMRLALLALLKVEPGLNVSTLLHLPDTPVMRAAAEAVLTRAPRKGWRRGENLVPLLYRTIRLQARRSRPKRDAEHLSLDGPGLAARVSEDAQLRQEQLEGALTADDLIDGWTEQHHLAAREVRILCLLALGFGDAELRDAGFDPEYNPQERQTLRRKIVGRTPR